MQFITLSFNNLKSLITKYVGYCPISSKGILCKKINYDGISVCRTTVNTQYNDIISDNEIIYYLPNSITKDTIRFIKNGITRYIRQITTKPYSVYNLYNDIFIINGPYKDQNMKDYIILRPYNFLNIRNIQSYINYHITIISNASKLILTIISFILIRINYF